jgi:hypothetical protein
VQPSHGRRCSAAASARRRSHRRHAARDPAWGTTGHLAARRPSPGPQRRPATGVSAYRVSGVRARVPRVAERRARLPLVGKHLTAGQAGQQRSTMAGGICGTAPSARNHAGEWCALTCRNLMRREHRPVTAVSAPGARAMAAPSSAMRRSPIGVPVSRLHTIARPRSRPGSAHPPDPPNPKWPNAPRTVPRVVNALW